MRAQRAGAAADGRRRPGSRRGDAAGARARRRRTTCDFLGEQDQVRAAAVGRRRVPAAVGAGELRPGGARSDGVRGAGRRVARRRAARGDRARRHRVPARARTISTAWRGRRSRCSTDADAAPRGSPTAARHVVPSASSATSKIVPALRGVLRGDPGEPGSAGPMSSAVADRRSKITAYEAPVCCSAVAVARRCARRRVPARADARRAARRTSRGTSRSASRCATWATPASS